MTWHHGLLWLGGLLLGLGVGQFIGRRIEARSIRHGRERAENAAQGPTLDAQQALWIMDYVHEALHHDESLDPDECTSYPCDHLGRAYAMPTGFVVPPDAPDTEPEP